jgi:CubicO group peptidase (beta-lactamase class C family)
MRGEMRNTAAVLAVLCWTLGLEAQSPQQARPAPAVPAVTGRSALPADRLARIDGWLQRYIDDNKLAGAVVLVLRDGHPVYERAMGWSDKEAGRRMKTDTIFRIASQTKAITSAAILSLMEEGRVGLNDPVSRFIPGYAQTTVSVPKEGDGADIVPARRPITIRDLLTHTAGISYGTDRHIAALYQEKGLGPAAGAGWYTADKDEPICDTMERLGSLPFVAQPGAAWVYGYSTDILGCVVERASGVPLDEFLRTRITGPLGMKDTQFFLAPAQRDRLAVVYATGADGTIVRAPEGGKGQGDYVDGPRRSFAGGAGLLSTARDYARFLEMIRNGGTIGGVRILAPRTVRLMTTNQVGTLHAPDLGFGFGFETTERFGASSMDPVGAFGWGGAYGSIYRVDPESAVTMVLMIQLMPDGTDIRTKFPNLVYQALVDLPKPGR